MHNIVLIATKMDVCVTRYIVVSCDEVMMISNQSWVNIHTYFMEGFKHITCIVAFGKIGW
jgi:hypothetical protein